MISYQVSLGCQCPGAIGWPQWHEAESLREALTEAMSGPECCDCGERHAESGGEWVWRSHPDGELLSSWEEVRP